MLNQALVQVEVLDAPIQVYQSLEHMLDSFLLLPLCLLMLLNLTPSLVQVVLGRLLFRLRVHSSHQQSRLSLLFVVAVAADGGGAGVLHSFPFFCCWLLCKHDIVVSAATDLSSLFFEASAPGDQRCN